MFTLPSGLPDPIETERLTLRCPVLSDIDAIVGIAGDWEVARRLARMPHPYTTDDARFFLAEIVPAEPTWAITLRATGAVIGMVGLMPRPGTAELGYYLGSSHWCRGYASEASARVVDWAFAQGAPFLVSGHFSDNPASGRVLAKLGFEIVGTGERDCLAAGGVVPSIEVRLERSAWEARKPHVD